MSFRLKTIVMYGTLALCVALAVMPLFQKRYIPTHDGEYHIIRIVEFSRMISSGNLFPRWAPTLNSGFGVPVFQFNYPFPNYVGYVVRLITHDAVYAFQYSMALGYILIAAGIFLWLSTLFSPISALVGAIVGMYVPYVFLDMYIRGSIGEIWATGFFFLTLYCIEKKHISGISFAFAFLILSHNIMALIYTPVILLYTTVVNVRLLWPIFGGIGMSAFFWLPALVESKFVVGLNTVNFREHFVQLYEFIIPSWGSQFSGTGSVGNKVSFQIGLVPILTMLVSAVRFRRPAFNAVKHRYQVIMTVFLISLIFMSSVSGPIWELIPFIQNIQYPWRLLALVVPAASLSAAIWAQSLQRPRLGIIVACLAVAATFAYARPVTYEPRNEAYYLQRANFTDGTSSMGNSFSTIWTGWKQTRALSVIETGEGMILKSDSVTYLDKKYLIEAASNGEITFNVLYFPGWKVYIDGKEAKVRYQPDGIIHISVPEGKHTIRLLFANTPVRTAATILSVISLATILSWGILFKLRKGGYTLL